MKLTRRTVAIIVVVLIAIAGWFAAKQYRCNQRNAAFRRRIENIERDARENLKIGTKKVNVVRFFADQGISLAFYESEAMGTIQTTGGCAPLGCGTDSAIISVHVKLDAAGSVAETPKIGGMYTNCL